MSDSEDALLQDDNVEAAVSDCDPGDQVEESADVCAENQNGNICDEPTNEDEETEKNEEKRSRSDKRDKGSSRRRKRYFNPDTIHDIMAENVKKQRNEAWKKTVILGPIYWEDTEDSVVKDLLRTACTCSIIRRTKPNDSTDCHLELRFVNHGDAYEVVDQFERPIKTRSGHTIRRRTRMPLESQLQEWDQTMFSRMYMGNRVFLYVDNIPPTALKEDVFATFHSCSYITYSLKSDMLTGYAVLEYRSESDIEDDLSDAPKMLHGNVLNTFPITRQTQFHDRGRPVSFRQEMQMESDQREYGSRRGYDRQGSGRYRSGGGGGGYRRDSYDRGGSNVDNMLQDPRSLGGLESMLLQEIGRKVMMQGSMGSLMDSGARSSASRYGAGRRW